MKTINAAVTVGDVIDPKHEIEIVCGHCGYDRDESAHAVTDDDRASTHASVADDRHDLVRPTLEAVVFSASAIAVSREVERGDPIMIGITRRDVAPPMRVGPTAVNEHEAASPALAPSEVVNPTAVDFDPFVRSWNFESARRPCGERNSASSSM